MEEGPRFPDSASIDLTRTYDAVVVGSGAAGGMAANVLTARGLDVLLLEAGRHVDTTNTLKSTEWPYQHPRQGKLGPETYVLDEGDYYKYKPPYGRHFPRYTNVVNWQQLGEGPDYTKEYFVDEKEHPYTGTQFSWVRARALGGKTNVWGRLALRLSDYDFKAASRDGYGDDWPITYADIAPYYDKVDRYLGISGINENIPWLPDSIYQRPMRLNEPEVAIREKLAPSGRVLTPFRLGVTTDGLSHNKYRHRCMGRGACQRRVGGCDIHAAFDSPTGLIYPAYDTGKLTVRTNAVVHEVEVDTKTGKAKGVAFLDAVTRQSYSVRAKVVVLGASTLESTRIMLNSRSRLYPNGIANSSGHLGHNLCEHVMGPRVEGIYKPRIGGDRRNEDGRPGGFYIPRFRNIDKSNTSKDFIRGYGLEGAGGQEMFPEQAILMPGFGASYKKKVRDHAGAFVYMYGLGEVLPRFENQVSLDPDVKDVHGVPVLRFSYRHGDNEKKMCADMTTHMQEIFSDCGLEITKVSGNRLAEGSSVHEVGTARMGNDPKSSVLNAFCQSHDVKNLYVVDGSSFVSAGNQNPTWTILALAWRACDHLAEALQRGEL
ncbi:MAG: GMC family oxidoreductase [Hyphomicrobiaceae bacterium]|nr:GMC family oxidoreductase [Hyphomicrobiaceae bacterium]